MAYQFDRYLNYEELVEWCTAISTANASICRYVVYGKSHEGRDLFLLEITDFSDGEAITKPAQWVDANIHSIEVTAGVAALNLIQHLVSGYHNQDPTVVLALHSRTFYIVPRVNPDGVEAALSRTNPQYFRSSVRKWPYDGKSFPGFKEIDMDGDGHIRRMRMKDDNGAWCEHPLDKRVMIPIDHKVSPYSHGKQVQRYRVLPEGRIDNYDGFTIPTPAKVCSLDLNRNFPAGWGKNITGSGDHALSEVEIYSMVKAMAERVNICGANAYHTSGGILLRPSSTKSDSDLPQSDVYVWKEILGPIGVETTGLPLYSCYEDFTLDKKDCMSGAADDYAYEHIGIFSFTTEFYDVIYEATGKRASTKCWYYGPTVDDDLAICKWADANCPETYVDWKTFQHPQLGEVEIGGYDAFNLITNPPLHMLKKQIQGHAEFAVQQALLSPKIEIIQSVVEIIGEDPKQEGKNMYRIKIGVANTGFLPTNVSEMAIKVQAVLPLMIEISTNNKDDLQATDGYSSLNQLHGQLSGRLRTRLEYSGNDGTSDRCLATFFVTATAGIEVNVAAKHTRAGVAIKSIILK